jgi:hypothetical protein
MFKADGTGTAGRAANCMAAQNNGCIHRATMYTYTKHYKRARTSRDQAGPILQDVWVKVFYNPLRAAV